MPALTGCSYRECLAHFKMVHKSLTLTSKAAIDLEIDKGPLEVSIGLTSRLSLSATSFLYGFHSLCKRTLRLNTLWLLQPDFRQDRFVLAPSVKDCLPDKS